MTDETLPPGLWEETRQAAAAWKQGRGDEPAEPGPALVGQVRILPELDEPRLAWAILRREQKGKSERLLLVAADVNPLIGSGDVAVNGAGVGSLTLRCRFAVWVSERELGAATLLGTLPPEALARADSRRQAVEDGGPIGTFSEQETEEDPEYQDWIADVVRPAVVKLETQAGADAPSPLPFPTQRPIEVPSRRGTLLRWAAVLAFVGLGAGSGLLWVRQQQEIDGLQAAVEAAEATHRQAIAELQARRADLEAQFQARLRKAGEDRARLVAEHRARLQEPRGQAGEAAAGYRRQEPAGQGPRARRCPTRADPARGRPGGQPPGIAAPGGRSGRHGASRSRSPNGVRASRSSSRRSFGWTFSARCGWVFPPRSCRRATIACACPAGKARSCIWSASTSSP